ncbi:hypothetical protein [Microbulbifer sp. A4B17]|uniref:hypothetical protein n=1 Tax=Microbulbifer sp. A4B17 TaxID=359370 RepID=UPI0018646648|nr:hypothetical protein [Microbulbifer sp. A4B17]
MERYALLTGTYNLLMGGIKDFKRSYTTEEEAFKEVQRIAQNDLFTHWAQIFDKKNDKAKIYRIVDKKVIEEKPKDCPNSEPESKAKPQYA